MILRRIVPAIAFAAVVGIVVLAFVQLGPQSNARAIALDLRRVDDLRAFSRRLDDEYGGRDRHLPATVPSPPADPISHRPYEYRRTGPHSYELCATFERAATPNDSNESDQFARHGAGRTCFRLGVVAAAPNT